MVGEAEATLDAALERIIREIKDGLKHGFFEYTIECQIVKGGKRGLVMKAGKNFRFNIPEHELE